MPEESRFAEADLKPLFRPKIEHFKPLKNGRDQFGNRAFSAHRQGLYAPGYFDKEGRKYKAALLTSPEGERLIKDNPGILNDIDRGISSINNGESDISLAKQPSKYIHKLWNEANPNMAVLNIKGNKYLLKWLSQEKLIDKYRAYQPFINEMLQVQHLQKNFAEKLLREDINVILPTYFFASGFLLCKSYEPGHPPSATPEVVKRIDKAIDIVWPYVNKQREVKGSLWENVYFDTADWLTGRQIRTNNFILRPDNKLAWIDPFAHISL